MRLLHLRLASYVPIAAASKIVVKVSKLSLTILYLTSIDTEAVRDHFDFSRLTT